MVTTDALSEFLTEFFREANIGIDYIFIKQSSFCYVNRRCSLTLIGGLSLSKNKIKWIEDFGIRMAVNAKGAILAAIKMITGIKIEVESCSHSSENDLNGSKIKLNDTFFANEEEMNKLIPFIKKYVNKEIEKKQKKIYDDEISLEKIIKHIEKSKKTSDKRNDEKIEKEIKLRERKKKLKSLEAIISILDILELKFDNDIIHSLLFVDDEKYSIAISKITVDYKRGEKIKFGFDAEADKSDIYGFMTCLNLL